jgi:hypothetical protein
VEYILKGKSTLTEMYSAIEAEVPIPSDPSTHIDWGLLERLKCAKQVRTGNVLNQLCLHNIFLLTAVCSFFFFVLFLL